MSAHIRTGALWGMPVMKFTLTYDGPLRASGNKPKNEDKWAIRKHIHPQLLDLWSNHPALKAVYENRYFPKRGGAFMMQTHHEHGGPILPPFVRAEKPPELGQDLIDLCEPIHKHGSNFVPLVRESFALHCGLKIIFLRKEQPGRVYQGGDIDGRIKTLLDALAMPQHVEQVITDPDAPDPMCCLLEDDAMVSALEVQTERLLTDQSYSKDYARLNIEVDVRVRRTTIYNQSFLGG